MPTDWIAISLQLLASAMSLAGLWKIGDRSIWGQGISLVAQAPWMAMNIYCGLWGILPCTLVFAAVNVRNYIKWRRDAGIHQRDPERPSAVPRDHAEPPRTRSSIGWWNDTNAMAPTARASR